MTYNTPAAFRTALETRLNGVSSVGVGVSRLRKRVVFERFLARLLTVAPTGWYLKGGFALELRLGALARTTKDVDVDWVLGEDEATELLLDAAACDLADEFEFEVRRSDAGLVGDGQRWTVRAELAGRLFEQVAIDVGFARPPVVEPDTVLSSQLLEFADIGPIVVPALAVEQHLAEKLHAYTRIYAGGPTSRVKDLVDVVVIARSTVVDAGRLWQAVGAIFERRATHALPNRLPAPPAAWEQPWAKLIKHLPADRYAKDGFAFAAGFWDPVLLRTAVTEVWNPAAATWGLSAEPRGVHASDGLGDHTMRGG